MIKYALTIAAALLLATHALAQKTGAQLNSEISTNFPDQSAGQITPSNLRTVTQDMVNSIMPTAPVVNGNNVCFNGTTGLLKDCGTATGNVSGPGSSIGGHLATYNGTTGQVIQDQAAIGTGQDVDFASGRPWCGIIAAGAVGGNAALDTAAFNSCLATLAALGGGIISIPPNASCYLINAINATAINNISIQGAGASSCLTISSIDSAGNWLDLSGSNGWSLDNLKIIDNGSVVPGVAILWACTGTQCGTSGVLHDLYINRLYIGVHTSKAIFYGYGFGNVSPVNGGHGNSLKIDSSSFVQLANGSGNAVRSKRNTTVHLTATNDLAITSANKTVTATSAYSSGAVFINSDFADTAGLAGGSNNTGMVLYNEYPFTMIGGSIKCSSCDVDLTIASNNQGLAFYGVNFVQPGGSTVGPNYWVGFVEGLNTFVTIDAPFFSTPIIATILMGPPAGAGLGGVWYLQIRGTNNAGNFGSQGFIYTDSSNCAGFGATSLNWIQNSYLQLYAGGANSNIQTGCGGIDSHTIFQGALTVTVPTGATDSSHHF